MKYTLLTFTALSGVTFAQNFITPDSLSSTATSNPTREPLTAIIDGVTDSSLGQGVHLDDSTNTFPLDISFAFDTPQKINGFRLWNGWNYPGSSVEDFTLTFKDSGGSVLGSFSGTGSEPWSVASSSDFNDFSFAAIDNVSSIDWTIISTTVGGCEIREVAFSAVPVPEPSSPALLGLAGLALVLRRRK